MSVLGIILVVFGAAALILVAAAVFFFYVCSARGGEKIAESIIASGLEVPEAPNPLTAAGGRFTKMLKSARLRLWALTVRGCAPRLYPGRERFKR